MVMFPKPTKKLKKRRKSIRAGVKTTRWSQARGVLKEVFEDNGVTSCEVRISGICVVDRYLSFAHGDKRRYLSVTELYILVALACIPCHEHIEYKMNRREMRDLVTDIVARRRFDIQAEIDRRGVINSEGNFIWLRK